MSSFRLIWEFTTKTRQKQKRKSLQKTTFTKRRQLSKAELTPTWLTVIENDNSVDSDWSCHEINHVDISSFTDVMSTLLYKVLYILQQTPSSAFIYQEAMCTAMPFCSRLSRCSISSSLRFATISFMLLASRVSRDTRAREHSSWKHVPFSEATVTTANNQVWKAFEILERFEEPTAVQ